MSLPRYPKYKDSGVEWLGEVPEHWQVQRLKQVCMAFPSNVDKKSHEGEQSVLLCNYTDVYYNERITADLQFMAASASQDQIEKFALRAGDTLITKDSETADDIAVSSYVPDDLPGVVCGYHLSIVRPGAAACGGFVKRLFDSAYSKATVAVKANGLTRVGLSQYDIDNIEWPWPPAEEQTTIAAFLDRETSKIDALIAQQQLLVELLKEKRQAVISRAVTKGLKPDAPMRPSGIGWLGEVPAHWATGSLRHFATMSTGSTPDRSNPAYWGGQIPWVKTGEINYTAIVETEESITQEGAESCAVRLAPPGTLLMALYGQGATRGRVAILKIAATYNQACAAIQPHETLDARFLQCFLTMAYPVLRGIGNETTQMNLNLEFVQRLGVVVPPIDEQMAIVDYLDRDFIRFQELSTAADKSVQLLQNRRSALISAAVTGQIDVRKSETVVPT